MSDLAIRVENLSKQYKIGAKIERYYTLRDSIARVFTHPFRRSRTKKSRPDSFWALKDVSFEIQPGEIVGIIGRNGAGKTTLLKILSRITEPTAGRAEIYGRVGSLLEVGTGFHPELTGRENIFLNGAILGMKKAEIERKFDEIVAFAEVEKFLDTPVKHYSSGMYVRLAFAVAANLEPDILLVDEVLAVGDAAFQKKCLSKMEDVSKGGRTVLFVSHNMGAVRALCSKAILLEDGNVISNGDTESVIAEYQRTSIFTMENGSSAFGKRPRKDCTGRNLIKSAGVNVPSCWLDPFEITIDYEVKAPVDRFCVEWFIKDLYGVRVMSGLSALVEDIWFLPGETGTGQIKCTVKEWRLPGGRYSLCVLLTIPLIECMDYVEDLLVFDVPDMHPGKPGFTFSSKYGFILPKLTWGTDPETRIAEYSIIE